MGLDTVGVILFSHFGNFRRLMYTCGCCLVDSKISHFLMRDVASYLTALDGHNLASLAPHCFSLHSWLRVLSLCHHKNRAFSPPKSRTTEAAVVRASGSLTSHPGQELAGKVRIFFPPAAPRPLPSSWGWGWFPIRMNCACSSDLRVQI